MTTNETKYPAHVRLEELRYIANIFKKYGRNGCYSATISSDILGEFPHAREVSSQQIKRLYIEDFVQEQADELDKVFAELQTYKDMCDGFAEAVKLMTIENFYLKKQVKGFATSGGIIKACNALEQALATYNQLRNKGADDAV